MNLTQPPDDDRTVMPSSAPGSVVEQAEQALGVDNALPAGTALGEFEITGLIGAGGFGIVYLAYDHSLQRRVALKEYMPSGLAARKSGVTVAKSKQHVETFQAGLRSFINEARLLAQFDHPSLVKVHRFWEANGTAYMIMPFYEGSTLKETLRQRGEPPTELWLKQLLGHLLDALEIIHKENCFHRDIAPDNILILKDGRPLLLDFGAARRVISDMTQNLTVILKPGYAPIEQYAEMNSMQQGAWTDIYALAAVIYFAVTGKPPVPAVARIISDSMVPLTEAIGGQTQSRYSPAFLHGIDKALAVKPEERPRDVATFRRLLDLAETTPITTGSPLRDGAAIMPGGGPAELVKTRSQRPLALYGFGGMMLLALIIAGWFLMRETPIPVPVPITPEENRILATPAIPAGDASVNEPETDSKPHTLREASPVTSGMTSGLPPKVAPGIGQGDIINPEAELKSGIIKRGRSDAESSVSPEVPTRIEKKRESSTSAIEKVINASLIEGKACLSNKNFECAIAKAETVLQLEPGNAPARALLKDANIAQQKAWEASELK
ncbi:serine/threonine protein kinase [Nitrosospira sp. Nsp5]|uniref:non-specific serine/threonine protein kinase n=1 Tax=Nitrosospira multiformis TaxID=1231 RepID=A0ABY0TDW4_9PROT|nr:MULTISPECIES: serine/threonine-protein kinase [Nitrosospira]PTR08982.1 serine/threonine protein kinase [Nitrosospira sp. Nsp5]SDQ68330.1 Serine/threonine protein kinase [Nitrosospira multiformis]